MIRALYSGATGMYAQQLNIDNISNNLANVNTNGFKKSTIQFQDLMYQNLKEAGTATGETTYRPTELTVGVGVKPVSTNKIFTQGHIEFTGNPLDVAIAGDGFFQLSKANGEIVYTRDGTFRINAEGDIVNPDGYFLEPSIVVPYDAESVNITPDGIVQVKIHGMIEPEEIGQLDLVRFINPAGLESVGGNLYRETVASGFPNRGVPGEDLLGQLKQGYVERSNVAIVEEMVNMIIAQRAYEVNSKTVRTSEHLLEIANNLKR